MKTPPQSLPLAIAYMRVIFCALPALYMYAFVMAVLRAAGDSKTPFYFMMLSVGLDISLNPLFIFGFGPVPRLGIAGSALATFIAQTISLTAMVRHLYRRRHILCLTWTRTRAPAHRLVHRGRRLVAQGPPDGRGDLGDVAERPC